MPDAGPPPETSDSSRRRFILPLAVATVAAAAVQPLVLLAQLAPALFFAPLPSFNGLETVLAAVVAAAATVVLVLGVPTFLWLRHRRRDSWRSMGLAGALISGLPSAWFWPCQIPGFSSGGNWHGGHYVDTYVDGVPTVYAWLQYAEGTLVMTLHGLCSALVFYAVWRWLAQPSRRHPASHETVA